jgi:hypothetical protein
MNNLASTAMIRTACIAALLALTASAFAQDNAPATSEADELAKKLQNPVASLISVPLQGNYDFGIGANDGARFTLNVQPVVPMSLSPKFNLITRLVLPVVAQNNVFGETSQSGLSDGLLTAFLSPKAPTKSGLIWGAGPAFLLPTGTDDLLATKKFGVGPSVLLLKQSGSTTMGLLVNHIVSVAGDEDRPDISNTFLQPFLARNFKGGNALTLNTELTQNWEAETVSGFVNLTASKVFKIGKQITQALLGPRVGYGPEASRADFGVRFGLVFLFPA